MRGNVENPIGAAQVPLGVAGPLLVRGEHAQGTFYVPLATTEGALVRSYERGMVALTRAGGAEVRVLADENRVAPVFSFADAAAAMRLRARPRVALRSGARRRRRRPPGTGGCCASTPHPLGREVIVEFSWFTGDAHGMNMIVHATDAACRRLAADCGGARLPDLLRHERREAGRGATCSPAARASG